MTAIIRALVAAPFVVLGAQAAQEPGGRVDLARDLGVPGPEFAVRANGIGMVVGGLVVGFGIAPRPAALLVAALMVPTTLAGHAYWEHDDPSARNANRIHFLKNVGLVGGLLAVAAASGDDE